MLTQSDTGTYTAKLMDFGIARMVNPIDGATMLTREGGSGPGTPIYMSPEQIAGTQFGPLSPASDVYAMGVVMYQMLAKRPPFQGTITDIFHGHLNASPPPIESTMDSTYPAELSEVVNKALAKHQHDRFASAAEFRYALKRITKARGPITTLAVAKTVASSGGLAPQTATVAMTPMMADPTTTNGLLDRRSAGARSASRTLIAIACIIAVVAAIVTGNVFVYRFMTTPDASEEAPAQTATGVVAPSPAQPGNANATHSAPAATEQPGAAMSSSPPVPAVPELPKPVSLDAAPKAAAEQPAVPAPKLVVEEPLPPKVAPAPKPKEAIEKAPAAEAPAETPQRRAVTPLPDTPKEEPQRTPPPQAPAQPDLSVPHEGSTSFSDGARQQFGTGQGAGPPSSAPAPNPFDEVRVNKIPAVKVN